MLIQLPKISVLRYRRPTNNVEVIRGIGGVRRIKGLDPQIDFRKFKPAGQELRDPI